jgi:hypothetical protein
MVVASVTLLGLSLDSPSGWQLLGTVLVGPLVTP